MNPCVAWSFDVSILSEELWVIDAGRSGWPFVLHHKWHKIIVSLLLFLCCAVVRIGRSCRECLGSDPSGFVLLLQQCFVVAAGGTVIGGRGWREGARGRCWWIVTQARVAKTFEECFCHSWPRVVLHGGSGCSGRGGCHGGRHGRILRFNVLWAIVFRTRTHFLVRWPRLEIRKRLWGTTCGGYLQSGFAWERPSVMVMLLLMGIMIIWELLLLLGRGKRFLFEGSEKVGSEGKLVLADTMVIKLRGWFQKGRNRWRVTQRRQTWRKKQWRWVLLVPDCKSQVIWLLLALVGRFVAGVSSRCACLRI